MGKKGKKGKKKQGTYLSPGVYVEEASSGARPIEAVGTAVAAFIGFAPLRPVRAAATVLALAFVVWAVRNRRVS